MSPRPGITVAISSSERDRLFPPDVWSQLTALGSVTVVEDLARDDVDRYAASLRDAQIVVTAWGSPPLAAHVLEAAPRLQLLAHAAGSVRQYVTAASWARGITVSQAAQAMAPAVAELAVTMTLVLVRKLHRLDHVLHGSGSWDDARSLPWGEEIAGCMVGVVGASRVGRVYIERIQALGATVICYDPYLRDPQALGVTAASLEDVMRSSRVVSLHAPSTPETHRLIGRHELRLLTDGGGLVNTARPGIVDMAALFDEVASGRIDAALDVHDVQPLPVEDRWRTLPNVLLTPHIGGKTRTGRRRQGELVIAEIRRWLAGEPLLHEVTADMLDRIG